MWAPSMGLSLRKRACSVDWLLWPRLAHDFVASADSHGDPEWARGSTKLSVSFDKITGAPGEALVLVQYPFREPCLVVGRYRVMETIIPSDVSRAIIGYFDGDGRLVKGRKKSIG